MPSFSEYLTFTTIVEAQSFTGAANRLHRSVSSVSKQLSKLEGSLGVSLIDRSTQSLAVTSIGEGFYIRCKEIIASVDLAEQYVKDELISPSGKITLSFPEVLLRTPLMDLLKSFNEQYPAVTFDLKVSNAIDDIIDGRIDFAFRMGKLNDSRLTAIALNKAAPVFCASPAYISHYGKPKTLDALFSEHRLILPSYMNLSEQLRLFFSSTDKLPISIVNAHTSNNESVLYGAVTRGMGIAIMLDISIIEDLKAGRLVELFPERQLPESQMFLVYHNGQQLPEKKRVFKAFIKENFNLFYGALNGASVV